MTGGPAAPAADGWARRAGRNVAALAVARGVTAVLSLGLTAYLTRALEPAAFGVLGFGTALLSYFLLVVNLGFDALGTRDVARDPARASALAGQITGLRLVLALGAYAAFAVTVFVLPVEGPVRLVLLVQGVALFAQALSVEWVFQGLEKMGVLAVRSVAAVLLHFGAVLVLVQAPEDVAWAAAAAAGALVVLNGWLLVALVRAVGPLRLDVRPEVWRALVPQALPIAASTFLISVYYNLDQVMLGLLRSEAEVGLYAAGWRASLAALLPAMVLGQAFFPTLAAAWGDLDATRARMRLFVASAVPLGFPIAAGAALLARPLLVLFAGDAFAPGAATFALLMANVAVVYLNIVFGQPLLAWEKQRAYMVAVGSGAAVNVALNAVLIPTYGPEGAAVATLAAEGAVLAWVLTAHRRTTGTVHSGVIARAALATGLGVVLPLWGMDALGLPLAVRIAVALAAYAVCAATLGLIPPEVRAWWRARRRPGEAAG